MSGFHEAYSPANVDANGFADDVSGASWSLSATTPGDGLGHYVTILNNSATDHSAKTAILTGTDENGDALTETVNLPAGTLTVTSTKYFKTLTSVVPSATIGDVDTMDIGWAVNAVTKWYLLNPQAQTAAAAQVGLVSGTGTFTMQETFSDLLNDKLASGATNPAPVWTSVSSLTSKTASTAGAFTVRATGARLNITASSSSSIEVHLISGARS